MCVALRCRPLSKRELGRDCKPIIETISATELVVTPPEDIGRRSEEKYTFDHVYGADSTQEQVFQDIGTGLVTRTLDGFNSTLFAYGQTGSGKTFTMMGDDTSDPFSTNSVQGEEDGPDAISPMSGLIPRVCIRLFDQVQQALAAGNKAAQAQELEIQITVSYLEIYNENIHDLLNPMEDSGSLKIREHPEDGIYVENLCELVVSTAPDVGRLIGQGNSIRAVAATQMNERSSRSHSVMTVMVQQRKTEQIEDMTRQSLLGAKLNLVDLAGSERASKTGAENEQLRVGGFINTSLMALGSVIKALSEGEFVNYRNSKLTRLLQESLGGNASTVMLAAISPADYNYNETMSTIRYAQRAKKITNKITRNEDVHEKMVRELQQEIDRLKNELAAQMEREASPAVVATEQLEATVTSQEKLELERKLAELEKTNEDTWQLRLRERERLTQELEAERQANLGRALGDIIGDVKDRKRQTLQEITRHQRRKAELTQELRRMKKQIDKTKTSLEQKGAEYDQVQQERERLLARGLPGADDLADDLAKICVAMEDADGALNEFKRTMKKLTQEIKDVDNSVEDLKAELVASSTLLQDNDRIRKQIHEEELRKWQEEKETLLAQEKEALRDQAKQLAEANIQAAHLKVAATEEELKGMRQKLVQSEVQLKSAKNTTTGMEKFRNVLVKIDKLRIETLKEELKEAKEVAAINSLELKRTSQEAEHLSKRVGLLETENASLQDSVEISQLETSELRHEVEELRRQQVDAVQIQNEARREVEQLTKTLQAERSSKLVVELELNELRATVDQFERDQAARDLDQAFGGGRASGISSPLEDLKQGHTTDLASVEDHRNAGENAEDGQYEDEDEDYEDDEDEFLNEAQAVMHGEEGDQHHNPVPAGAAGLDPQQEGEEEEASTLQPEREQEARITESRASSQAQDVANEKIREIVSQHQTEQRALEQQLAMQKAKQREKLQAKLEAKRAHRLAALEKLRLDEETKKQAEAALAEAEERERARLEEEMDKQERRRREKQRRIQEREQKDAEQTVALSLEQYRNDEHRLRIETQRKQAEQQQKLREKLDARRKLKQQEMDKLGAGANDRQAAELRLQQEENQAFSDLNDRIAMEESRREKEMDQELVRKLEGNVVASESAQQQGGLELQEPRHGREDSDLRVFRQMVAIMEQEREERTQLVRAERTDKLRLQQLLQEATRDLVSYVHHASDLEKLLSANSIQIPARVGPSELAGEKQSKVM